MTAAGMLAVAIAAAAAAVAVRPQPTTRLRRIVRPRSTIRAGAQRQVIGHGNGSAEQAGGVLGSEWARIVAVVMVAISAAWVVGGIAAPAVGVGVGVAAWVWLGRFESVRVVRAREDTAAALPLAADLLSAAVAAGSVPVVAADAVGVAVGGRLGSALMTAAATARVGSEPSTAWASLAADPVLRPLARALAGAGTHGASPVVMLQRVAEDARDAARWDAQARARALGARAAAPLGLCFLPAFVLVGIVPVVAAAGPLLP